MLARSEVGLRRELWDAKSVHDLSSRSDAELRSVLVDWYGLGALASAMRKADKISFITDSDIRPTLMAAAQERLDTRYERRRERRKRIMEAASLFDRRSKLEAIGLISSPFVDTVTGLDANSGVRARRRSSGEEIELSRPLAEILDRRGVLVRYGSLLREAERGATAAARMRKTDRIRISNAELDQILGSL